MKNTDIKIQDKVVFNTKGHINGLTGIVEEINNDEYVVRLDKSPLKFFSLISAKKEEIVLAVSI